MKFLKNLGLDFELKPWNTPENVRNFSIAATTLLLVATLFMMMFTVWKGGSVSSIFTNYTTLVFILFLIVIVAIVQFTKRDEFYASIGKPENAIIGVIVAGLMGIFLGVSHFVKASTPTAASISIDPTMATAFILLVIPLVEEKFFGRTLPFLLRPFFKSGILTLGITCFIFAMFHVWTAGAAANPWGMFIYNVIFRGAMNIGNSVLKTSMFGNTFHYINNAIAIFG